MGDSSSSTPTPGFCTSCGTVFDKNAVSKLWVNNIPSGWDANQLAAAFSSYGKLHSAAIPINYITKKQKQFGFVHYVELEHAVKARFDMHGRKFDGHNLVVDYARPSQKSPVEAPVPFDDSPPSDTSPDTPPKRNPPAGSPGFSPISSMNSLTSEKSTLNPHPKDFNFNQKDKSFVPSQMPVRPASPASDGSFNYPPNVAPVSHMQMGTSFSPHQPVIYGPQATSYQSRSNIPQHMHVGRSRQMMYMPTYPPSRQSRSGAEAANDTSVIEDEAEVLSVFVKNVPFTALASEIEEVFKKFGKIRPNGVAIRTREDINVCYAFVEYEDSTGVNNAIKASTVKIAGQQVFIERRRANRVDASRSGRGRGRGYQRDGTGRFVGRNYSNRGNDYDCQSRTYFYSHP